MRELVWYHVVVVVRAYIGGVITEFMGVLIVVSDSQDITFPAQTMPVEIYVGISEHIRLIGHTLSVCHIRYCASHRSLHIVAHIHLSETTTEAYPL